VNRGLDALNDDVHAVVLDVKLKGQTKYGACEMIRKAQPDVPIILYAARGKAEESSGAVSQHKPFGYVGRDGDPQKLLDALDLATRLYQTTCRSRRLLEKLKRRP
jgi:DNA-binding NarL/FixJ family response regulator